MGRNFFDLAPPEDSPMPESVPPKEIAKAAGKDPNEQAPGVPREPMAGDQGTVDLANSLKRAAAPKDPDAKPGDNFKRIRWVNKIGGHEQDEEWAEERRAHNLVGSGHAELVEEEEKGKGKK
jgi:hypothetical protein